jgi:hypothetical protein
MPAPTFIDLTPQHGRPVRVAVAHIVTLRAEKPDGSGMCEIITVSDRFSVRESLPEVTALIDGTDQPSDGVVLCASCKQRPEDGETGLCAECWDGD